MSTHKKHNQNTNSIFAAIGAALAGLAVYKLFVSPRGSERRERIAEWAQETTDAVKERMANTRDEAREDFEDIVDEVVSSYAELRQVGAKEARDLADELKASYGRLSKEADKQANKNIDTITKRIRKNS